MTSFIIKDHVGRLVPTTWAADPECAFCRILRQEIPASVVYENEKVIAILDILPLRAGHTLVIPKAHISRLSDLPPELASALGEAVSKVADDLPKVSIGILDVRLTSSLERQLLLALDNTGLNVVCNQEYAQAVPHVHYHVIPAPILGSSRGVSPIVDVVGGETPLTHREMHQKEFESREELDEDDAEALLTKIRARL